MGDWFTYYSNQQGKGREDAVVDRQGKILMYKDHITLMIYDSENYNIRVIHWVYALRSHHFPVPGSRLSGDAPINRYGQSCDLIGFSQ